jgi:tRNA G18 (ribose-2'-O)-methylase SpoU
VATVVRATTVDDPALADFVALTDTALRRTLEPAGGLFVAEGETVIRRAVAAGYPVRSVLLADRWLPSLRDLLDPMDVVVHVADDALLHGLTGFAVHRGALASMGRLPLPTPASVLQGADHVVVLEGIANPTNVGAVFRSVAALGADAVLVDPRCADPLYRRSVKVSMGAVFSVPYARVDRWPAGLAAVRDAGLPLLALTPAADAVPLADVDPTVTRRCALLLGTEGDGLSGHAFGAADLQVRIPMAHGVDSLNVAAAAAVALWSVLHPVSR